jgi:hypothetical protein
MPLNKGEAKNALARAVLFNCLGEVRDRSFEHRRYRASTQPRRGRHRPVEHGLPPTRGPGSGGGPTIDEALLRLLSPLGWEHINLTGD